MSDPNIDFVPPTNEEKQARIVAGRNSAEARAQNETLVKKEFGQTNEENYWYTYWWIVGWNQYVDSIS
jgi:hypothetical protein